MIIEFRKNVPDKKINLELKKQIVDAFLQCNNPNSKAQAVQNLTAKIPIIRND